MKKHENRKINSICKIDKQNNDAPLDRAWIFYSIYFIHHNLDTVIDKILQIRSNIHQNPITTLTSQAL